MGGNTVVNITTRYRFDIAVIDSRWGAIISAHVQTGAQTQPTSRSIETGLFPWGKAVEGLC